MVDLALHPREQACCRRTGLTAERILCKPAADVGKLLNKLVSADGLARIHRAAAVQQAPRLVSALDMLRDSTSQGGSLDGAVLAESNAPPPSLDRTPCYSTGDLAMDRMLGGGVHCGALTELVGQSGAGKTQMMLQTAIFATLALRMSVDVRLEEHVLQASKGNGSIKEDVVHAVQGYGILPCEQRKAVALIVSSGHTEARMLLRRMSEMCDALVQERWDIAAQRRRDAEQAEMARTAKRRGGTFSRSEDRRYSLREAQAIAQREMFSNLKLAMPTTYAMLELQIKRDLPTLAKQQVDSGRASLGLIIIDDVTNVIQEAAKEMTEKPTESSVVRSRLCCELSDNLKHLAASCALLGHSGEAYKHASSPAILVSNHVTSVMDRHKQHILPVVEQGLRDSSDVPVAMVSNRSPSATQLHSVQREQNADLTMALQELHFGGIAAQLHESLFHQGRQHLQRSDKPAEVADGILSSLRLASLGLSWMNCINVRIVLMHTALSVQLPRSERRRLKSSRLKPTHVFNVRRAVSVVNPFAAAGQGTGPAVEYVICPSGLHALSTLRLDEKPTEAVEPFDDDRLWSSVGGDEVMIEEAEWATVIEQCESRATIDGEEGASQPSKRVREA